MQGGGSDFVSLKCQGPSDRFCQGLLCMIKLINYPFWQLRQVVVLFPLAHLPKLGDKAANGPTGLWLMSYSRLFPGSQARVCSTMVRCPPRASPRVRQPGLGWFSTTDRGLPRQVPAVLWESRNVATGRTCLFKWSRYCIIKPDLDIILRDTKILRLKQV